MANVPGMSVLYTVNIIYFLKLYSVNIHTVDNQFRHKLTVVTLITSFLVILRQYTSNFVTSPRIYLAWSEWNAHSGHLFRFGGFMRVAELQDETKQTESHVIDII